MRSTYAAAMIILFMTNWNAYLWPLIVLQTNEMKTITLTVASLATAYTPDYGADHDRQRAGDLAHDPRLLPAAAPLSSKACWAE